MELELFHVGTENIVEEEGRGFARVTFVADLSEEEYLAFVGKKHKHKLTVQL